MMKGYRTLLTNGVIALAAVASLLGVIIPQDEQTALIAGVVALVNIALRLKTSTAWGKSGP